MHRGRLDSDNPETCNVIQISESRRLLRALPKAMGTYFTEYKFAPILSAALSRTHDLPPSRDLSKVPLPPVAHASSCKITI
ncbi:hypothetical protein Mapa_009181 [Marchantia paleacea]|nr:hypothetical protein Mapa_009181 [Marchantia paleacea]